jgi:hypothetical protein
MVSQVRRYADEGRALAALHYLLVANELAPLSRGSVAVLAALAAGHASAQVRAASLWLAASRGRGREEREALLLAGLADGDLLVRRQAAEGLAELGTLPHSREAQSRIFHALGTERSVGLRRLLIEALSRRGVEDRPAAVRELACLVEAEGEARLLRPLLAAMLRIGGKRAKAWFDRWAAEPWFRREVLPYREALRRWEER